MSFKISGMLPSLSVTLASCLLLSVQASYMPIITATIESRSAGIAWGACDEEIEAAKTYNTAIDCANLTVPLDYTNQTKGTLELNLLRAHSPKGPSRGTVLFNFGGPGCVGRLNLVEGLEAFFPYTGFVHDLVVFDPRGTANTIPMFCYNSTEDSGTAVTNSNASDTAKGEIWVGEQNYGNACLLRSANSGPYMGTAAVARDLMSVVDALNEDGLLRYYGISYGTILGVTAAAMFPDRIDKMYLDGVGNAHEYYHSVDTEWISDADKVWSAFFVGCANASSVCPLAQRGKSASQLEEEFYQWIFGLKQEPFSTGISAMETYTSIKALIGTFIYSPLSWLNVSRILDAAYQNNIPLFNELLTNMPPGEMITCSSEGTSGIKCSDKIPRKAMFEEWLPEAATVEAASRILGDVEVIMQARCAQWKMSAVEIYKGDFHVKTRAPVLFASNEFDPVTPLVSAKNMSSRFEGSALLINKNGYGHSTTSAPSVCIIHNVANYWVNSSLPAVGTVCEPNVTLFGNVTAEDVLAMAEEGIYGPKSP